MLPELVLCVMFEARHSWPGFHGQTMRSQCSRQHGLAECYKWKRNRIFGCCSLCVLKFAKKLNRKCANNFLINKWKQKIKRAPVKHTYFCDSILRFSFDERGWKAKVKRTNNKIWKWMKCTQSKRSTIGRLIQSNHLWGGRGVCVSLTHWEKQVLEVFEIVFSASVFWFPRMRCFPRNV